MSRERDFLMWLSGYLSVFEGQPMTAGAVDAIRAKLGGIVSLTDATDTPTYQPQGFPHYPPGVRGPVEHEARHGLAPDLLDRETRHKQREAVLCPAGDPCPCGDGPSPRHIPTYPLWCDRGRELRAAQTRMQLEAASAPSYGDTRP